MSIAIETHFQQAVEDAATHQGHIIGSRDRTQIRVKDFGLLTVGNDAHGNSLYHDVQAAAQERLKEIFARL